MGTADCIAHPDPTVVPSPDLGDLVRLHLPELQSPMLEDMLDDVLEDQLEAD